MPQTQSQEKAGSLEALARAHFPRERGFTAAERRLLAKATEGEVAVCGPSSDAKDPTNDPSKAEKSEGNPGWGREREIGTDLIRWLCVDHKAKEQVDPGGIYIQGAKITGELNLNFVIVPFPIRLWRCALIEDAFLQQVEIPRVELEGAWTKSIQADGAIVKGGVLLRNGFHADGEVRWLNAQIGGNLDCDGGSFNNRHGVALSADSAIVKGSVFLRHGFHADGEVVWLGAHIDGDLDCESGTFDNSEGYALRIDRIEVKGSISLMKFTAQGEVNLRAAQIGGDLNCIGGRFDNPKGGALVVERAGVKGNVYLRDGFNAQGSVALGDARIEGGLDCERATLEAATLDLRGTKLNYLRDDRDHWPQPGNLFLDGFVYGRIDDGPKDAETRLRWLALQPDEKPFPTQPYLQLAKVLREGGDNDGAVSVLEEMERRRRRQADQGRPDRQALSWLFREFAGYGYDPARSVGAIAALSGLGWILYRRSYLMGGMVLTEKDASGDFKPDGETPSRYETFAPLAYSVENSLPLVKLGQAEKWQPNPDPGASPPRNGKWIKSAGRAKAWPRRLRWLERRLIWVGLLAPVDLKEPPSRCSRLGTSPRFLRWFLWMQILLGWLLATLFVAGVTGIIRKD